MDPIAIRRATRHDASQACEVLVRSIREICAKDYGHDTALLDRWCANKTVENVTSWIENPAYYFIVAQDATAKIVGVGLLQKHDGEIMLCYILPEVLHQGAGRRILADLEQHASLLGHTQVRLDSTITARHFYLRNGYTSHGEPSYHRGVKGFPLRKFLGERSL